jgi:hypothetical protein
MGAIRPVFVRGLLPAWQETDDDGRGRMQAAGVDEVHHGEVAIVPRRRVDETPDERKCNLRKTSEN